MERTDTIPIEEDACEEKPQTPTKDEAAQQEDELRVYREKLDDMHNRLLQHILDAPASVPKRYKEFAYSTVEAAKMMVVKGSFNKKDVEF